jgi:predicted Ser/Thr protein kinase
MPEARPLKPGDPDRLGDHSLDGRLGQGGQGVVFLGRDRAGEPVAVKLLYARLIEEPTARSRFVRELESAKEVVPFCTARVLDAGVDRDRPYIVSEYVRGPSLQRLVAEEGPRGRKIMERLATGTASALAAIHRAGVMHRDFKPANVLLASTGPRVNDFGLAAALDSTTTATGHLAGTPAFMAPEQLTGTGVGPAADVFAWGATMLFAATGSPPFGGDSAPAVMHRVLYEQPDLRALPESLRDAVAQALSKDVAQRPSAYHLLIRLLGLSGSPDPTVVMTMGAEGRTAAPAPSAPESPRGASDTVFLARPSEEPAFAAADPLLPGLEAQTEANSSPAARDGHTRAVIASLVIGVLAGIVVIMLVLGPQLGGGAGEGRSGTPAPAPDDGPVDSVPAAFHGTWRGTAVNQRGARFPVQVTFQSGRTTATVLYPPPTGCNGTLTLTEGTQSRLSMALRIGRPCTDGGAVTVTRQADGSLGYAWAKQGTHLHYRATLKTG